MSCVIVVAILRGCFNTTTLPNVGTDAHSKTVSVGSAVNGGTCSSTGTVASTSNGNPYAPIDTGAAGLGRQLLYLQHGGHREPSLLQDPTRVEGANAELLREKLRRKQVEADASA